MWSENFHARFFSDRKTLSLQIWAGPVLRHMSWPGMAHSVTTRLRSFDRLERTSSHHDFAAFAAIAAEKKRIPPANSIGRVRKSGPRVRIDVAGDGFLYKMARLMVGAMVRVTLIKWIPAEIARRLNSGAPDGFRYVAPAAGLYLAKIWY